MSANYQELSQKVFTNAKYPASDYEIRALAKNMKLLDKHGLDKLNKRLLESTKKVQDTLAEHNFAVKLILHRGKKIGVRYEPDEKVPPPDFEVVIEDKTYWIQMKKLANLERENRQNKIYDKITLLAKNIQVGMFFGCELTEQFSENDIEGLIYFLKQQATNPEVGKTYFYPNVDEVKAVVDFWNPNKTKLQSLTLGIGGNIDVVEVTGLAQKQIKNSLKKASYAFKWDVSSDSINLIAMDADNHDDIDLCNAIFGTEFEKIDLTGKHHTWSRKKDGFFCFPEFSKKVAGIIMLRSKLREPVSNYYSMLYINERFKDRLDELGILLDFDKVISFNIRHPMGKGNFDLP
jgi:hypothetical protein